MLVPAGPHWLGSPQHVVAGAVLALVLTLVATRRGAPWWLAAIVGIGVTAAAEIALKLAEYLYFGYAHPDAGAYYDSLVDNTSTLAGALIGAAVAVAASRAGRSRSRRASRD